MAHLHRVALLALLAVGCRDADVSVPISGDEYDEERIRLGRLDTSWHASAERDRRRRAGERPSGRAARRAGDRSQTDTTARARRPAEPDGRRPAGGARPERFEGITPDAVNAPARLPVRRSGGGPSTLRAQIMLDRVGFSPGVLDGRWGKNTAKAVYWYQHARGLATTGTVDGETYARLAAEADDGEPIASYRVANEDLAGPFVDVPDDAYARAELDCLCYASPQELLSEKFHATPEVLEQLNPAVDFDTLEEGTFLHVPGVPPDTARRAAATGAADVARIIVSRNGYYTHALDESGDILFHFPSTLGSGYDPSPTGDFRIVAVTRDPHFHYQPSLFHDVPDDRADVMLPPGPNSPVGLVWMALSKPHYGIHGTAEPRTIGYTSSHGCVRLTNWDARLLADHVEPPVPVEFR